MIIRLGLVTLLALTCYANPLLIKATEKPVAVEYMLNMPISNIHYGIDLVLTDKSIPNEKFTGKVTVDVTIDSDLSDIRIHSDKALVKEKVEGKVSVVGSPAKDLSIKDIQFDEKTKISTINLNEKLLQSSKLHLIIDYDGKLRTDMYGFYISKYKPTKDSPEETILTTQFQPTHARSAFPCFDEPAYKATFTISIKYPKALFNTVLSNQELASNKDDGAKNKVSKFKKTPKMSTYLVAFVVSSFTGVQTPDGRNIYVPKHLKESANYALTVTDGILKALNEYTGVPYGTVPYPDTISNDDLAIKKLDQVAIPDFAAGAMENWGLVTYRETALLWDPKHSTRRDNQRIATVIAHEFAHMWFGNLVTLGWWDNTWLNEGFARFFEYHGTAAAPAGEKWDLENQFVIEQQQSVFTVDGTDAVKPLNGVSRSPSEVKSKFGSISYNKGACVIRMIKNYMGEAEFKKVLKPYQLENQYNNVQPFNLFEKLGLNADNSAPGDVMKSWISNPGYPVVNVKLNGTKIEFTQSRFTYSNLQNHSQRWDIPIKYSYKSNTKGSVLFPAGQNYKTIELPADTDKNAVFLANTDNAYYRVNYDKVLLDRISVALNDKTGRTQIQPINRAQVVDDLMNLARGGMIGYDKVFPVLEFLAEETNYYPWYSALTSFSFLRRRLPEDSLKNSITEYMKKQMTKFYEEAENFEIKKNDDQIEVYRKVLALQWACELDLGKCKENALELFKSIIAGKGKATTKPEPKKFDVNFRAVVYCAAARHDTAKDEYWNYLKNMFENSNVASEKVAILTALGCSKKPQILNQYLEMSINSASSGIRQQDAYSVFTAVLTGNPEGVDIALEFLQKKFTEIKDAYGGINHVQTIITVLADRITTDAQGNKLKTFMKDHKEFIDDDEVIQFAKENIDANKIWVAKNRGSLTSFFGGESDNDDKDDKDDKNGASSLMTSSILVAIAACLRQLL